MLETTIIKVFIQRGVSAINGRRCGRNQMPSSPLCSVLFHFHVIRSRAPTRRRATLCGIDHHFTSASTPWIATLEALRIELAKAARVTAIRPGMESLHLLDTPKRVVLKTRSATLRGHLKGWEKSFAASHSGHKPGKDDIKQDPDIAAKYKEYSRVRDVLTGKLEVDSLAAPTPRSRSSRKGNDTSLEGARSQRRTGRSGVSSDRSVLGRYCTPTKSDMSAYATHPSQLDPYDSPASASPSQLYCRSAIGPTPQRDGKVLGLFDMLSNSGGSSQATQSINKRRKIDMFGGSVAVGKRGNLIVTQTPSKKRAKNDADILDHLGDGTGNEHESAQGRGRRYSRTPVSEGKKFSLSHFFATPRTLRLVAIGEEGLEQNLTAIAGRVERTPLRSLVLNGQDKDQLYESKAGLDATPSFLKRHSSFTFKERLMSVSTSENVTVKSTSREGKLVFSSPTSLRTGPRTLRTYKSAPKPLSEIVQGIRKMEDERYEDDLDALREMGCEEGEGDVNLGVLVEDSQLPEDDPTTEMDATSVGGEGQKAGEQPLRVWKKKGQKRTTRRANMRPVKVVSKEAPRWVEADGESEDEIVRLEETQLLAGVDDQGTAKRSDHSHHSSHDLAAVREPFSAEQHPRNEGEYDSNADLEDTPDQDFDDGSAVHKRAQKPRPPKQAASKKPPKANTTSKNKGGAKPSAAKKAGTINPNAPSHMNFRSLKIRNKNSKAKGRARYGRGR